MEGNYPAAYSLTYLEGELPVVVEEPVLSTRHRRALFKDPFEVVGPVQLPAVVPPSSKHWAFEEFTTASPKSNLVIGGTSV